MATVSLYAEGQGVSEATGQGVEVIADDRYLPPLLDLFPDGLMWPRDLDTLHASLVRAGLAVELSRVEHRAEQIAKYEANPYTSEELLSRWEDYLDLPETASASTLRADRQRAAGEKFTTIGGQSPDFFIEQAAKLGYEIEIQRGTDGAAEIDVWELAEGEIIDDDWSVWIVHARNGADDAVLEAAIRRFAPQGYTVIFLYDLP